MASTFKLMSKSYDGRYLELSLTQTKNVDANTSTIAWTLEAVGGDDNYYSTGPTTVMINNVQVCYYARKSYSTKAFPAAKGSVSGTVTVSHNSDGSCTVPVSLTAAIYTTTTSTVSGSWVLDSVPRASSITSVGAVTLGNVCSIRWTPASTSFRYKLTFTLGAWSYTTAAIHPNTIGTYTFTGYTVPLDVAQQIAGDDEGTMTVTLTTFTDSACTSSAGSDSETFTVTVPSNSSTQPDVTMTLTPALTPIAGFYLQGQSKVQAEFSAEGKLGATIEHYILTADGTSFGSPYLSNYLTTAGDVEITGTAVDSRGITGTTKQTITVLPYYRPKLSGVAAYRCTSDGVYAENGEYLKIEATRDYAPVSVEGVQNNFCSIRYRYKAEKTEAFSDYVTVLDADAEENTVVTEPLLNAAFYKSVAFVVQVSAIDTVGQETVVTIAVPSERVFRHKRAGGRGLGLGGYCEEDDLLDVYWNQRVRGNFRVYGNTEFLGAIDGPLEVTGALEAESYGGLYIQTVYLTQTSTFTGQSSFTSVYEGATGRQSLFVFGSNNGTAVYGLITIHRNGTAAWSGTGDMSVSVDSDGKFTAAMVGSNSWGQFTIFSAKPFTILQEV